MLPMALGSFKHLISTLNLKRWLPVLFAVLILIGLIWGVLTSIGAFWHALTAVNPALGIGIVSTVGTVLAATVTVMLGRYFERKREIEATSEPRKLKFMTNS